MTILEGALELENEFCSLTAHHVCSTAYIVKLLSPGAARGLDI